MTLDSRRANERRKYDWLYSHREYGTSNHGREALPLLKSLHPSRVLDVGCGGNSFVAALRRLRIDAVGVDLCAPGADVHAAAHALPFEAGAFDWLTAFDVLEHLLPEEVDEVLQEFARVTACGWIFSISYRDSTIRACGESLHPTIRPERWWVRKLSRWIAVQSVGPYLWGELHDHC